MPPLRDPVNSINFAKLDQFLRLHDVQKLAEDPGGAGTIFEAMIRAAGRCKCWGDRDLQNFKNKNAYLEKYLGIGNGNGETIHEMKDQVKFRDLLSKMTEKAFACKCGKNPDQGAPHQSSTLPAKMPPLQDERNTIDFTKLDHFLRLKDVEKLAKDKDGPWKIINKLTEIAKNCTCWEERNPALYRNQQSYLEKYLEIGKGNGTTLESMMKKQEGFQYILLKMTRAALDCKCEMNPDQEWPYETTLIYRDDSHEATTSRMLWLPKRIPENYKKQDNDDWKYDMTRPIAKASKCPDDWLRRNVFGQNGITNPDAPSLQELKSKFKLEIHPSNVPILVGMDVERSVVAMDWKGAPVPPGKIPPDDKIIAKVPLEFGFSSFDPMDAWSPNTKQMKRARDKFQVKGDHIPPGNRGLYWKACGLIHTELFFAEVEAQLYHVQGNFPRWAENKGLLPDSGSITFHNPKPVKMADMKRTVLQYLQSLRHTGRKEDDTWTRPLIFVTWAPNMEIGALRFLELWDFVPGGCHDQKNAVKWIDLQDHPAVMAKTATVQGRGQKRKLTSFIADDLRLYDQQIVEKWAHNAGMDAAFTLEGFIALFTLPDQGLDEWAQAQHDQNIPPQNRTLDEKKGVKNTKEYDKMWVAQRLTNVVNFKYRPENDDHMPIQERTR